MRRLKKGIVMLMVLTCLCVGMTACGRDNENANVTEPNQNGLNVTTENTQSNVRETTVNEEKNNLDNGTDLNDTDRPNPVGEIGEGVGQVGEGIIDGVEDVVDGIANE